MLAERLYIVDIVVCRSIYRYISIYVLRMFAKWLYIDSTSYFISSAHTTNNHSKPYIDIHIYTPIFLIISRVSLCSILISSNPTLSTISGAPLCSILIVGSGVLLGRTSTMVLSFFNKQNFSSFTFFARSQTIPNCISKLSS